MTEYRLVRKVHAGISIGEKVHDGISIGEEDT
jgi:hypothetical protein